MAPGLFQVKDTGEYLRRLKTSFVIVSPEERKDLIVAEVNKAAAEVGGAILPDEELLEIVTHLVEYPLAIRGGFSKDFLSLPREVLISAMREHQRYFSVVDSSGALLPYFVTVSNTKPRDIGVVTRGNERVLQARLSDAKFFFLEDQKVPLVRSPRRIEKSRLPLQTGHFLRKSHADFPPGRGHQRPRGPRSQGDGHTGPPSSAREI